MLRSLSILWLAIWPVGFASAQQLDSDRSSAWSRIAPYFKVPSEFSISASQYRSPLLRQGGDRITTPEQWSSRRQELLETWHRLMGPWPEVIESPKLEVLSQQEREGITQKRVKLEIAPGQTGEGWLLVPAAAKPLPAVLVVFYEPETSVGLKGNNTQRDFGWQLAKAGMITLNIGTPGGDAYKPEVGQAQCQPLSFHAYVAANCWQALAQMPEVDSKRIGIVGHSYGGKWSMFAGALWDKFAVVAVSDPGIVFDETRPSINYWEPWYLGRDANVTRRPGVPKEDNPVTGAYKTMRQQGHDLHEIQALICPRPFLVSGGSEDPVKRWDALQHAVDVNGVLGVTDRVGMTNRPDHSPNAQSNAVLVDFFTHFLLESTPR